MDAPSSIPSSAYAKAVQFLYELRWFGAKLGLENTLQLAELAGNPHRRLRFIHVAGTNGKGSTCAMLEAIYRAAGLKVGLFTSPHLVSFGERIQVNRHSISEAAVVRLVTQFQPLLKHFPPDHHPTFFEVVTIMAMAYFAERECDLVILETGLGGRLDATNIVTPMASVITNIQYDHQKWLGATLASIAAEKAGIIKPDIPSVTAADEPEALQVIRQRAAEQRSPLTLVTSSDATQPPLDSLPLPLPGRHQALNAALAVAVVRVLQNALPVSSAQIREGLSKVNWPGRLQIIQRGAGRQVVLDGAHNPAGALVLAQSLRELFPGAKPALILGILEDKNWAAMCETLAPLAGRIVLVPVHSERTAAPHGLAAACERANPGAGVFELPNLEAALADCSAEALVIVAGSLYLVGEAMEILHLGPGASGSERGLNEWGSGSHKPSSG